jgi:hypothetical protein
MQALDKSRRDDYMAEDVENLEEPEFRFVLIGMVLWLMAVGVYVLLVRFNWIQGL